MKKVFIQFLQPDPDGPVFGRVIEPADQMEIQNFFNDRVTRTIKDLLVAGAEGAQVAGFAASVTDGLGVEIAAGDVVDANGVSYELDAEVEKILNAADPANPRIDLIYATLSIDVEAESELRPHRRLRTQLEQEAGADPYPETQYTIPTELHTKATINVRVGVPDDDPEAPALNAGEVPLWHVRVDAGETELEAGDLTDVRVQMESLWELSQRVSVAGLAEIVQDVVGAFIANSTSIVGNYDDAGNLLSLALHSTYKGMLDDATSAATASKLMKRDVNADVQVRDIKPTRQILFSDNSLMVTPRFTEQQILIFDLETPVTTNTALYPGSMATVNGGGGLPFSLSLKAEDFLNIPLALECIGKHAEGGLTTTYAQLWNVTDGTELTFVRWTHTVGPSLSRSPVFYLTGSGRKKLHVRLGIQEQQGADVGTIWTARLICYPAFSTCGGFGQSACAV